MVWGPGMSGESDGDWCMNDLASWPRRRTGRIRRWFLFGGSDGPDLGDEHAALDGDEAVRGRLRADPGLRGILEKLIASRRCDKERNAAPLMSACLVRMATEEPSNIADIAEDLQELIPVPEVIPINPRQPQGQHVVMHEEERGGAWVFGQLL